MKQEEKAYWASKAAQCYGVYTVYFPFSTSYFFFFFCVPYGSHVMSYMLSGSGDKVHGAVQRRFITSYIMVEFHELFHIMYQLGVSEPPFGLKVYKYISTVDFISQNRAFLTLSWYTQ